MKKFNIIYISRHGHTKRYAMMVAEKLGVNAYDLKEAKKGLKKKESVIFMTSLANAKLQGYKKVAKKYNIETICAVGMSFYRETLIELIKLVNGLPANFPVFYAQGGLDPRTLNKAEQFVLQMSLAPYNNVENPTEEDVKTIDMLSNAADYVDEEKLQNFYNYLLEE